MDAFLLRPRENRLLGIERVTYELMELLSDEDNVSNKTLKVLSIVGFGGLGKTSLVKAMYAKLLSGFDCSAFVLAGQNRDFKNVLEDIIFELTDAQHKQHLLLKDHVQEKYLIEQLRKIVEKKRYLIVIDDIWDENLSAHIKDALSNENNFGSLIMTTTRIVSVAKAWCSTSNDLIHQMKPMSDVDSNRLFCETIFGSVSGCSQEFERIPRDILKKCGGVPLAIICTSSFLAMKPRDEWHILLESIGRGMNDNSWDNMRGSVSLSYYDLPPHLKTCLLYLCTFPGSHTIERDRLVKKWIAEGMVTQKTNLIRPSNDKEAKLSEELSLEEVASQYLDELVNRNVIHPLECSNNGEVITYHIHPMMHDALKAIAIEEKFAALLDDNDISRAHGMNFRHLSIDCPDTKKSN